LTSWTPSPPARPPCPACSSCPRPNARLDLEDISIAGQPASRRLSRALRDAGFSYDFRRHRISRTGKLEAALPYRYLGADDRAGPNYTGQPAVTSNYE
jgi:hypothetical protein